MLRTDRSRNARERASAQRRRDLLPTLLGIAGFFSLLMIAAALQGTPSFRLPEGGGMSRPPTPLPLPERTETAAPLLEPGDESPFMKIIAVVLAVLIGTVILVLVFFALRQFVRALVGLWRDRPLSRRGGAHVDVAPSANAASSPEPDSTIIRRGIAEALHTISGGIDPGDGIVAAWIGLEESAADAGMVRAMSETPAEFTVRILGRRARIAADVTELLRLYEAVRFGGRIADDDDRRAAARCLGAIEEGWR